MRGWLNSLEGRVGGGGGKKEEFDRWIKICIFPYDLT